MSVGISDDEVDMFGLPMVAEKGRGRPAHVWTRQNSDVANLLFACGHKPIEIARVLKISKPTFYKYYFNEIGNAGHAPLMMKARQLARLNTLAEGGNVTAEKALAGMIQAERLAVSSREIAGRPPSKSPSLGKKAEAEQRAQEQRGLYEPPSPPSAMTH